MTKRRRLTPMQSWACSSRASCKRSSSTFRGERQAETAAALRQLLDDRVEACGITGG
jgi:hypothetical protein